MATAAAKHFIDYESLQQPVYDDSDEWSMWKKRGDPVLHIGLLLIFVPKSFRL